jgi:membrane protease YdiL (CAAX protease family)
MEWPEMSSEGRRLFLLPISIMGYLGAVLLIAGIYIYAYWRLENRMTWSDLIIFLVLVLPLIFWFFYRGVQVIRSSQRYNDRAETGHK